MLEQRKQGKGDLLDVLAEQLSCSYLSDLKSPMERPAIAQALLSISAESYSLAQWNEALAYLCGIAPCSDAETAREQLLQNCS